MDEESILNGLEMAIREQNTEMIDIFMDLHKDYKAKQKAKEPLPNQFKIPNQKLGIQESDALKSNVQKQLINQNPTYSQGYSDQRRYIDDSAKKELTTGVKQESLSSDVEKVKDYDKKVKEDVNPLTESALNFAQGAANVVPETMKGLEILSNETKKLFMADPMLFNAYNQFDEDSKKAIPQVEKFIQTIFPANPEEQKKAYAKFFQGLGNAAASYAVGGVSKAGTGVNLASKVVNSLPLALFQSNLAGAAAFDDAKQNGASDDIAFKNYLLNASVAAPLEALPVANALERLNNYTGGGIQKTLLNAGINSVEEAITGGLQQTFSNVTARELYDRTRDIMDGVGESAAMEGGAGFVMNMLLGTLKANRGRFKGQEKEIVDNAILEVENKLPSDIKLSSDINTLNVQGTKEASDNILKNIQNGNDNDNSKTEPISGDREQTPTEGVTNTLQESEQGTPNTESIGGISNDNIQNETELQDTGLVSSTQTDSEGSTQAPVVENDTRNEDTGTLQPSEGTIQPDAIKPQEQGVEGEVQQSTIPLGDGGTETTTTVLSEGEAKPVLKEGFTEGEDLKKIYSALKEKYGDKKAAKLYEVANRLVNPNKNTIVEIRGNGVVVKEGDKYLLKPFGNTDANSKQWTLYKGLDVTDQFTKSEPTVLGKEDSSIEPNQEENVIEGIPQPSDQITVTETPNQETVTKTTPQETTTETVQETPEGLESATSKRWRLGEGAFPKLKEITDKKRIYYEKRTRSKLKDKAYSVLNQGFDNALNTFFDGEMDYTDRVALGGVMLENLEELAKTDPEGVKTLMDDVRQVIRQKGTDAAQTLNALKDVGNLMPPNEAIRIMYDSVKKQAEENLNKSIEKAKEESIQEVDKIANEVSDSRIKELEAKIRALEDIISSKKTQKRKEAVNKAIQKIDSLISKKIIYSDATGLLAVTQQALNLVKISIKAGDAVVTAIEKGIRFAKSRTKNFDAEKFKKDIEELLADDRATLDELYDKKKSLEDARKRLKESIYNGLKSGDFSETESILKEKEMSQEEINTYIEKLNKDFEDKILVEKLKKLDKNLGLTKKRAESKTIDSIARKIAKDGPLTDVEKEALIKKDYDLKDAKDVIGLLDEAEKVKDDPNLYLEKLNEAREEILKYKDTNIWDLYNSVIYYPFALSNYSTTLQNIKDSLYNNMITPLTMLRKLRGQNVNPLPLKRKWDVAKSILDNVRIILAEGAVKKSIWDSDVEKLNIAYRNAENYAKLDNFWGKLAKRTRYVGRIMEVPSELSQLTYYQAMSNMIYKDLDAQGVPKKEQRQKHDDLLFGTEQLFKEIEPKARQLVLGDATKKGDSIQEAKVRRTIRNMVLSRINDQITDKTIQDVATELADQASYRTPPKGTFGAIAKSIQNFTGKTPINDLLFKKTIGLDFLGTTANAINSTLNYTPYAYLRANDKSFSDLMNHIAEKFGGDKLIKETNKPLSEEEKNNLIAKADLGTSLLTFLGASTFALAFMPEEEKDKLPFSIDVIGSTDPNSVFDKATLTQREAKELSEKPYTVKLKSYGKPFFELNYLGTPLQSVFGFIGNTSDYIKEQVNKGVPPEDILKELTKGIAVGGLKTAKTTTWDATPLGTIQDRARYNNPSFDEFDVYDWASQTSAGVIGKMTTPSLVRGVARLLNPTNYNSKDWAGRMMIATGAMNYAGAFGLLPDGTLNIKNGYAVDLLGNKIQTRSGEKFINMLQSEANPEDQEVYDLLSDTYRTPSEYPKLLNPNKRVDGIVADIQPKNKEEETKINIGDLVKDKINGVQKIDDKKYLNRKLYELSELKKDVEKSKSLKENPYLYTKASEYRGKILKDLLKDFLKAEKEAFKESENKEQFIDGHYLPEIRKSAIQGFIELADKLTMDKLNNNNNEAE